MLIVYKSNDYIGTVAACAESLMQQAIDQANHLSGGSDVSINFVVV